MVAPWSVYWLAESDALTVQLNVPAAVGAPLTPPSEPSVRPPGAGPPSGAKVSGEAPPAAQGSAVTPLPLSPSAMWTPVIEAVAEVGPDIDGGVVAVLG